MLFRDIYKSHLAAHTGVINKMLGKAFNGDALRLPKGTEKVLLTVAPGLDKETGKTVLYINAMISNFDDGYDATEQFKEVTVGGGKYNKTPKGIWWSSHTRVGVQGVSFTKMLLGGKIYLRYHGGEGLLGQRGARAYRVKYGNHNTTIFELVKGEHSYWIDPATVCVIGTVDMPVADAATTEAKTAIPNTAQVKNANGKITKIPVSVPSHRQKKMRLRSLADLGAAMRETA